MPALPTGRRWPSESWRQVSLQVQERVIIGSICFLAFVVVAYLFGIFVLNWLQ
jgi:hypothetical protein